MSNNISPDKMESIKSINRKPKRHKTLLVIICLVCIVAASVYFFLPGLFRSYNLGVQSSETAYMSAMQKFSMTKDQSPVQGKSEDYEYVYGKPQAVDTLLDSEEITSFFNVNRPSYYALENVQVRVNSDGTIEASATIDTDYVFSNILNGKYTREDVKRELPMLGLLPGKVNIYSKISCRIVNNKLEELDIQKAGIMGIGIPESLINSSNATTFIKDTIGGYLEKTTTKSNVRYESVEVKDGKLVIKGQIPSSITRIALR